MISILEPIAAGFVVRQLSSIFFFLNFARCNSFSVWRVISHPLTKYVVHSHTAYSEVTSFAKCYKINHEV